MKERRLERDSAGRKTKWELRKKELHMKRGKRLRGFN